MREVFIAIREKQGEEKISLGAKSTNKEFFSFFEKVLPNYSRESVYASDVKKIVTWYNLLTEHGIDFEEEEEEQEEQEEEGSV